MNGPWAEVETSDMNRQWTKEERFFKHGSGAWIAEERSDMKEQWATIVR